MSVMAVSNETAENNGSGAEKGLRVLVVEDHEDTAWAYRNILDHLNCEVRMAGTVAEALDILLKESFDVILSDVGLPDGDGVKLIHGVRRFCQTPAIAITAYDSSTDVGNCLRAGFDLHMSKPVDINRLFGEMKRLAGR